MFAAILLSALSANAAPTKRQALGNTPGELIKFDVTPDTPYSASSYCLATNLAGGALGDGTPLAFVDCHSVQTELPTGDLYGLWDIHYGNQESVRLVGTNYCIDAGSNPGSDTATPAKVWTCYPGLEQQQFYYTGTNHIAVTGSTPCLQFSQYDGTQFVPCGSNGDNAVQAFSLQSVGQQGMSSSMMPSPSSTMMPMPSSSSMAGKPIYWANGNSYSQCLTVTNGQFYDGSPVGIAECNGGANQMWNYADYGVTSIQVAGQNFCIDFGTGGGSDGTPMKIWQCYPGLFQQTMFYTATAHIAVYNGNQCLDVEAGTQNVQSWSCSGSDPHQVWSPTQAN